MKEREREGLCERDGINDLCVSERLKRRRRGRFFRAMPSRPRSNIFSPNPTFIFMND